MAETRNYNYGGVTPSWALIDGATYSTLASDQSYTTIAHSANQDFFGSTSSAAIYFFSTFPASNYRGNYAAAMIDTGTNQYYYRRVHSDVVTSSYNGSPVHKVEYGAGNTVFQRQLNFGKTVDNVVFFSNTSTSITWMLSNPDGAGLAANILAGVNQSTTEPTLSTVATNIASGSSTNVTFSGLSAETTYRIHSRTSRSGSPFNDSILNSERWNETATTASAARTWENIAITTNGTAYSPRSYTTFYSYEDDFGCPTLGRVALELPDANSYNLFSYARISVFDLDGFSCGFYFYRVITA
jgi:hypothetical protein